MRCKLSYVSRVVGGELALLLRVLLIATEVFPVEQCERVVDQAARRWRRITQYQVHAQHFIVGARKRYGPPMEAIVKVFGCSIAMQVSGHRSGHDECEYARVASIVELGETVE